MAHTKGPWNVSISDVLQSCSVFAGDLEVCTVRSTGNFERTSKERDANAHLISAAPDMLAALRAIRITALNYLSDDLQRRINLTINKAEGRKNA